MGAVSDTQTPPSKKRNEVGGVKLMRGVGQLPFIMLSAPTYIHRASVSVGKLFSSCSSSICVVYGLAGVAASGKQVQNPKSKCPGFLEDACSTCSI